MKEYKKVVQASAGTGKTYRLSLEFINILLSYKNQVNFSEILVITFTKKATAEIREQILLNFQLMTEENNEDSSNLWKNLQKINPKLNFCQTLSKGKNCGNKEKISIISG